MYLSASEKITTQKILWQPTLWFSFFLLFHLIIWTLVPTFLFANPPTDALEGVTWGNLWLFGYDKHPFLTPWITAFFSNIWHSVTWPIYLLGQLSVITCFWCVWRIAKQIVPPWHALLAVMLLDGIYFYTVEAPNFNPNVLMLAMWALVSLTIYQALQTQKIIYWLSFGIFAGLAMVSKYESALLLFLFALLLLITPEGRISFKKPGLYLACLIAGLIFLPNFYWLWQHNFIALDYAVDEMQRHRTTDGNNFWRHLYQPGKFLVAQGLAFIPVFLLYLPFYGKSKDPTITVNSFNKKFLLLVALGPLLLTLLLSLFTGARLISRWAFPFFSFTCLLWLVWARPLITPKRLKSFISIYLIIFTVLLVTQVYTFIFQPYHTKNITHAEFFPGKTIAMFITSAWHDYYHNPLPYIAGDHKVVVNVASFSADKPIAYFNWDIKHSPWINEADVRKKGAVFVYCINDWNADKETLIALKNRFPGLQHEMIKTFSYQTRAPISPINLWIAFLPPNK